MIWIALIDILRNAIGICLKLAVDTTSLSLKVKWHENINQEDIFKKNKV